MAILALSGEGEKDWTAGRHRMETLYHTPLAEVSAAKGEGRQLA
jgi:hypothetical protein